MHLQLVQDVLLHSGVGGGSKGHHGNQGELLSEHVQPLVVLTKIMTPLVKRFLKVTFTFIYMVR